MRDPVRRLETYPASMTAFDVALAPSGGNNRSRGKSDLRWLEASALGLPLVADPVVYPEIEHGVTGLHAASPGRGARGACCALVDDAELRHALGTAARAYVERDRAIPVVARQWARVLAAPLKIAA